MADVDAFIAACAALVKPGGLLFVATINRTAKAFALAIVGAEYLLRWLPRGTHDFAKLVRPAELEAALTAAGLAVVDRTGVRYNPLADRWSRAADMDVNYMIVAGKPAQHGASGEIVPRAEPRLELNPAFPRAGQVRLALPTPAPNENDGSLRDRHASARWAALQNAAFLRYWVARLARILRHADPDRRRRLAGLRPDPQPARPRLRRPLAVPAGAASCARHRDCRRPLPPPHDHGGLPRGRGALRRRSACLHGGRRGRSGACLCDPRRLRNGARLLRAGAAIAAAEHRADGDPVERHRAELGELADGDDRRPRRRRPPLRHRAGGRLRRDDRADSLAAAILVLFVPRTQQKTMPEPATWTTIVAGFNYIWHEKIVLGAISLDLFAVLLGGATALLPVYARDILDSRPVGPRPARAPARRSARSPSRST